VSAASIALLFVIFLLAFTPVGLAVGDYLMASTPLADLPRADAIVVLGGDPLRTADAVRLYRGGKAPMIILSGEADEALVLLDAAQVPRRDVRIDAAPRRTMDHPRTILAVPGVTRSSRLIVVSSKLQQRRALAAFHGAGYREVWVCSLEWELRQTHSPERLGHEQVACALYEFGARVKSWLVD